jgi:hypothetical protein
MGIPGLGREAWPMIMSAVMPASEKWQHHMSISQHDAWARSTLHFIRSFACRSFMALGRSSGEPLCPTVHAGERVVLIAKSERACGHWCWKSSVALLHYQITLIEK